MLNRNSEYENYNRYTYRSSPELYMKTKKSKSADKKIAAMMCATVLLSSVIGFGGGMLASDMRGADSVSQGANIPITTVASVGDKGLGTAADVAAAAMESVVEIRTESVTLGNRIMGQYISEGAGSGVIFSSDGYIVTNNHVIQGANRITVTTRSGDEYEAKLIGADAKTDLAVIKVDAKNLKAATPGSSENLVVGEAVVAIGNPLGQLGGTVTNGIISSLDREIDIEGEKMTLLQTDASVNPGNSGGGLFDGAGRLIGIVNAKSSGSGIEGLGFAIPIDNAIPIIEELVSNGYVSGRVDIGMSFMDVEERAAFIYGMKNAGVYVSEVKAGSAAEKTGIRAGDRIVAVDGTKITDTEQLQNVLAEYKVGDTLKIVVERGGRQAEASLTLEEERNGNGNLF